MRRHSNQSGMALALLMVMLAAVSLMVMGLTREARLDAKLTQAFVQRAQAAALADGAAHLAMRDVLQSSAPGGGRLSLPATLRYELDDHAVSVEVTPLDGLLDVRIASADLLRDVFRFVGQLDQRTALRIASEIQRNRETLQLGSPGAGETVRVLEDLLAIPGMDRIVYERIAPVLSVGGGGAIPSPATAPQELLIALAGGDRRQAQQWARARSRGSAANAAQGVNGIAASAFDLVVVVTMPDGNRLARRISASADAGGRVPWRFNRLYPVVPVAAEDTEAERA